MPIPECAIVPSTASMQAEISTLILECEIVPSTVSMLVGDLNAHPRVCNSALYCKYAGRRFQRPILECSIMTTTVILQVRDLNALS
jgi:hypothetical protein